MIVTPGRELEFELAAALTVEVTARMFQGNAKPDDMKAVSSTCAELATRAIAQFEKAGLCTTPKRIEGKP